MKHRNIMKKTIFLGLGLALLTINTAVWANTIPTHWSGDWMVLSGHKICVYSNTLTIHRNAPSNYTFTFYIPKQTPSMDKDCPELPVTPLQVQFTAKVNLTKDWHEFPLYAKNGQTLNAVLNPGDYGLNITNGTWPNSSLEITDFSK